MRIIPLRSMLLDGGPVAEGVAVNVSESEGQLALRHGWATVAPARPGRADKAAAEAAAKAAAAAEAEAEAAAQAQAEAEAEAQAQAAAQASADFGQPD